MNAAPPKKHKKNNRYQDYDVDQYAHKQRERVARTDTKV